jgi:hypothetical protein
MPSNSIFYLHSGNAVAITAVSNISPQNAIITVEAEQTSFVGG